MKYASLLAVGTEITSGDINNSNSQWLSHRLTEMGIGVTRHMTVADDTDKILAALKICSEDSQLIVLTGGLGPTKDDFTRHVVNDFLGDKLEFNEDSWQRINSMLKEVGVTVADSNRQQCFFPIRGKIYENPAGTANAFSGVKDDTTVVCLPGPPREISAIWKNGLQIFLQEQFGAVRSEEVRRWHCIGKSESQVGEIVEQALDGSGYTTGYRPHIPYVEVKVWTPADNTLDNCQYLKTLDKALQPWLAFRGDNDIVRLLLDGVSFEGNYCFIDRASSGILTERLCKELRKEENSELRDRFSIITGSGSPGEAEHLAILEPVKDGWRVTVDGQAHEIPYSRKLTSRTADRMRRYCTEMAFLKMAESWFIKLP